MKKILITGSEGFVGKNLIPVLIEAGNIIFQWDIVDGNDIFSNEFEDAVKKSDIVIHLAAEVSVDKSFKDPGKTFYTNVLGTARVVQLCVRYKKKLIYPSSAAIYHENLSPYAHSKALAEDIVVEATESIPVVVLRFFNIYGQGMNPESGSVMYRFLNDKEIVIFGDGEQTRDYINIADVIAIIEAAFDDSWNGQIVDVGSGHSYSTNYIAGLFAFYRAKNLSYEPPRREIKWSIADTKMLKLLYKKPLVTNLKKDIQILVNLNQMN